MTRKAIRADRQTKLVIALIILTAEAAKGNDDEYEESCNRGSNEDV